MIYEHEVNGMIVNKLVYTAKINEKTILKCIILHETSNEPDSLWVMVIENKFQYQKFERFLVERKNLKVYEHLQ